MRIGKFCLPLGAAAAMLCAPAAANAQSAGRLNINVGGVRNDTGSVRCGLYSSPNGFREPGKQFRGAVAAIRNGQATCVFNDLASPRSTIASGSMKILSAPA